MMEVQEGSPDGAMNLSTGGATSPVMNGDGVDQDSSPPPSPVRWMKHNF